MILTTKSLSQPSHLRLLHSNRPGIIKIGLEFRHVTVNRALTLSTRECQVTRVLPEAQRLRECKDLPTEVILYLHDREIARD